MGKPWKRKKKKRDRAHHGPCFIEGCKHNGSLMHHCKVCEKLEEDRKLRMQMLRARLPESIRNTSLELKEGWGRRWRRKPKPPFKLQFCGNHFVEANKAIKRHVLVKHPWLIGAWMAAKLMAKD